jgi:uncharacterized membrane protein YdjX (TVP38/TMEM64 family)
VTTEAARAAGPAGTKLLRPLLLLALVIGCVLVVYATPLGSLLVHPSRYGELQARIDAWGAWAPLIFVLACAGGVGVGAPRLAFAAIGGVAFGWLEGGLLAQVGTLGGCLITFAWARWLGRRYVEQRLGRRLGRLLDKVRRRPVAANIMLRVCPVGNNFLVNLFFGVSPVTTREYTVGTFIGTFPQTIIYAVLGSSAQEGSAKRLITGGGLLAALTVFYYVWSRRSKEAAEVAEDIAEDEADEPRLPDSTQPSATSSAAAAAGAPKSQLRER